MSNIRLVVMATDTDVGKTVFSAALAAATGASYWKPVQAGLADSDSATIRRLAPEVTILPEAYRLTQPLSPHRAAEIDGIVIDPARLALPASAGALIVEPAGGLMVPLTRSLLVIDQIAAWDLPVVLCARTTLGTINHSLLSIAALRQRNIALIGVTFVGDENADSERTICEIGAVKRLGRLPWLDPLTSDTLAAAFAANFALRDFTA